MNYLHYEFDLESDDVLEVLLDGPANVRLLDPENFERYRRYEPHRYQDGGYVRECRIEIQPPSPGHWHGVIDLGGFPGTIRGTAHVLKGVS